MKKAWSFCSTSRPDVPDYLLGDPVRLRQIVINLVGNAIKFTERAKWSFPSPCESQSEHRRLHFTVRDTGVGIPRDKQRIYLRSRSRRPMVPPRASTAAPALGLTISTWLVHMMGGEIWVESEAGPGQHFPFHRIDPNRGRESLARRRASGPMSVGPTCPS